MKPTHIKIGYNIFFEEYFAYSLPLPLDAEFGKSIGEAIEQFLKHNPSIKNYTWS